MNEWETVVGYVRIYGLVRGATAIPKLALGFRKAYDEWRAFAKFLKLVEDETANVEKMSAQSNKLLKALDEAGSAVTKPPEAPPVGPAQTAAETIVEGTPPAKGVPGGRPAGVAATPPQGKLRLAAKDGKLVAEPFDPDALPRKPEVQAPPARQKPRLATKNGEAVPRTEPEVGESSVTVEADTEVADVTAKASGDPSSENVGAPSRQPATRASSGSGAGKPPIKAPAQKATPPKATANRRPSRSSRSGTVEPEFDEFDDLPYRAEGESRAPEVEPDLPLDRDPSIPYPEQPEAGFPPRSRATRIRAEKAAEKLSKRLPPGWKVTVRSVPARGQSAASQFENLSPLDPEFAGSGYEPRITGPEGVDVMPDGIYQERGTDRFQFLDNKEVLTLDEAHSAYSDPAVQRELRSRMERDASIAKSAGAKCMGWRYVTKSEFLAKLMRSFIEDIRKTPGGGPLADLLTVQGP